MGVVGCRMIDSLQAVTPEDTAASSMNYLFEGFLTALVDMAFLLPDIRHGACCMSILHERDAQVQPVEDIQLKRQLSTNHVASTGLLDL